ncbi:glycoside hydrolase family 38 N-terminal domain-containing protein, partial [Lactiplantibacillus plantarum]
MTKAHFVNHTHWDREWYFTTEDAQVLSDQLFSNVLKELETHPEANFTLDGQTS